jgi:hypothetical protein
VILLLKAAISMPNKGINLITGFSKNYISRTFEKGSTATNMKV